MAEFAGYIGNQYPPTDWSKIGTQLLGQIDQEKERRKVEKEKIDNDYAESFAKIGEYEQTTDQDVNEFVYKGIDEVRNGLKTQYDLLKQGAITMADYKLYKTTAMSDWSSLNKAIKGFGAVNANNQKLITEGKMSGLGQYNALNFAKLGDLKTAKLMMNPQTGRLYRTNIDPKTGKIASTNDVYSPTSMLNPSNLVDFKVNIDDQVTSFLKRLGEVGVVQDLGGGKIKLVESAQNNPAYKQALQAQVTALTATPRSTTSVLTDYVGGYKFFESEGEKKGLIASGIPEAKLIAVQRKNGIAEPMLTDAQELEAQKFVKNQIEAGVGTKTQQTQGFAPRSTGSGGGQPRVFDIKQAEKVQLNTQKSNISKDIFVNGIQSQHIGLLYDIAKKSGLDQPLIKTLKAGDKKTGLELSGYEPQYDANGQRKSKAKRTIIYFRDPKSVRAYLSKDPRQVEGYIGYEESAIPTEQGIDVNPAPKEVLTFDMKVARAQAPGMSDQKIKEMIIKQYPGKRLIWQ
jgi:hypothetical protein